MRTLASLVIAVAIMGPAWAADPPAPGATPTPIAPAVGPATSPPAVAPTPAKAWAVLGGSTLRGTLLGWSSSAGWSLVWDYPGDFGLDGSATFSGDFESAVQGLIDGVYATYPDINATLYRGNRTLHVYEVR